MDCPKCGYAMSDFDVDCPRCKRMEEAPSAALSRPPPPPPPSQEKMGAATANWQSPPAAYQPNTSGTNGPVPAEVANMGFAWGAFGLGWIWGLSNKIYLTLLLIAFAFIPYAGPILQVTAGIWLGSVGHRLAWQHREFDSIEQFKATMRVWNSWGLWVFIASLFLGFTVGFMAGLAGATG
jgi:hypothetical protein